MTKYKSIKSILAGAVLATTIFTAAPDIMAAKNFNDLNSDQSHAYAVNLLNLNNVYDYKSGNLLQGNNAISRGEVTKILHNIYGDGNAKRRQYSNNFTDVNKNTPFYADIVWSYEMGIFDGSNGSFGPDKTLTRAQMAKILCNIFGLNQKSGKTFKDVSATHWAKDYIDRLATAGITTGSNGNFMPEKSLTLNQLSTFLVRDQELHNYLYMNAFFPGESSQPEQEDTTPLTYEEAFAKVVEFFDNPEIEELTYYTTAEVEDAISNMMVNRNIMDYSKEWSISYTFSSSTMTVDGVTKARYIREGGLMGRDEAVFQETLKKTVEHIKANNDLSSDYKIVKAVMEFIVDNLEYDKVATSEYFKGYSDIQEIFCSQYADLTRLLLNKLGVENRTVRGAGKDDGVAHEWNLVKVDGKWYHMDPTFAEGTGDIEKYLLMTQSQRLEEVTINASTSVKATEIPYSAQ